MRSLCMAASVQQVRLIEQLMHSCALQKQAWGAMGPQACHWAAVCVLLTQSLHMAC